MSRHKELLSIGRLCVYLLTGTEWHDLEQGSPPLRDALEPLPAEFAALCKSAGSFSPNLDYERLQNSFRDLYARFQFKYDGLSDWAVHKLRHRFTFHQQWSCDYDGLLLQYSYTDTPGWDPKELLERLKSAEQNVASIRGGPFDESKLRGLVALQLSFLDDYLDLAIATQSLHPSSASRQLGERGPSYLWEVGIGPFLQLQCQDPKDARNFRAETLSQAHHCLSTLITKVPEHHDAWMSYQRDVARRCRAMDGLQPGSRSTSPGTSDSERLPNPSQQDMVVCSARCQCAALLRLPAELREYIWGLGATSTLNSTTHPITIRDGQVPLQQSIPYRKPQPPVASQACRQMRDEIRSVYYGENDFVVLVRLRAHGSSTLTSWLDSLFPEDWRRLKSLTVRIAEDFHPTDQVSLVAWVRQRGLPSELQERILSQIPCATEGIA